jgi:hypothetical protein
VGSGQEVMPGQCPDRLGSVIDAGASPPPNCGIEKGEVPLCES